MDDCDFVYEYADEFDYQTFVSKMTPLVLKCIDFPAEFPQTMNTLAVYTGEEVDYSPEVESMFERMGIRKLDGKRNFSYERKFTYIEAVAASADQSEYYRYSVSVNGSVAIVPHYAKREAHSRLNT